MSRRGLTVACELALFVVVVALGLLLLATRGL